MDLKSRKYDYLKEDCNDLFIPKNTMCRCGGVNLHTSSYRKQSCTATQGCRFLNFPVGIHGIELAAGPYLVIYITLFQYEIICISKKRMHMAATIN